MSTTTLAVRPEFSLEEIEDLRYARRCLEGESLAVRLANLLGTPIQQGMKLLPDRWLSVVHKATQRSILRALEMAVLTLGSEPQHSPPSNTMHKVLVGTTGGLGGALGLASLPLELPISTTLMLRSIADIARSQGHDLRELPNRLACLQVFALAPGHGKGGENYWLTRAALSRAFSEASAFLLQKGVLQKNAPVIVGLVGQVASRFGVIVSEQVAAKAIPLVGAATGSAVNLLFMDHFQKLASGHFTLKRLEKIHGTEMVREVYQRLA
jgi:hypothetical protein